MSSSALLSCISILSKIQLFFGFYCYDGQSKILKSLLYRYCVFCFLLVIAFILSLLQSTDNSTLLFNPLLLHAVEYIINGLWALVCKGKFMRTLRSLVTSTDNMLQVNDFSFSKTMYVFLIFLTFVRLFITTMMNIFQNNVLVYLDILILFSLHSIYVTKLLVFYVIYDRMKRLRIFCEPQPTSVHVVVDNHTRNSRRELINKLMAVYDNLATFVENLDHEIHIWILGQVSIFFIKNVLYLHEVLKYILLQEHDFNTKCLVTISVFVITLTLLSLPIILFELARNELDKIKDILSKHISEETDALAMLEIHQASQYLNLRPLSIRIYLLYPFDTSLLFNFLYFSITYIIIFAQLS